MSKKNDKQKMSEIISILEKNVRSDCALEYRGDPWKLAVMARLSAQCTDLRVNQVCEKLFEVYPEAESMANADPETLEKLVSSKSLIRSASLTPRRPLIKNATVPVLSAPALQCI